LHEVNIKIAASTSKYWALLTFVDKLGITHDKEIAGSRMATQNNNTVTALIEALKALNRPCMLNIHTDSDYIISAIRLGWLQEWKRNGWQTAKGKEIKNLEQWKCLDQLLARHTAKIIKEEKT